MGKYNTSQRGQLQPVIPHFSTKHGIYRHFLLYYSIKYTLSPNLGHFWGENLSQKVKVP